MSWVIAIAGFMALIVLHEAGHFVAAKAVGMRVERFSLFFPPKLFGVQRGETEYMIGAIPAGGYVKITGMSPTEEIPPELVPRAYYMQAPWRRIVVIAAGPGVNLLIAFVLFWAMLYSGNLNGVTTLGNLNSSVQTLVANTSVLAVEQGEPAQGVLEPDDKIVAIAGHPVTVSSAMHAISAHRCAGAPTEGCRAHTPVLLTIRRQGRDIERSVYPRYSRAAGRMLIGFEFGASAKHFGASAAAGAALSEMWGITAQTLTNVEHAFTNPKVRKQFSSIVGITADTHEAISAGAGYALVILAFVSLALAIVNLFPFLPLDGGHILWAVAEKVRGRRVSLTAMWRFSSVGMLLLAFLVINGISNDISRLGG
jgi:regulator of sigma E protease